LKERALETLRYMNIELQNSSKKRYPVKVRFDLDQQQREYFLQQQMKTIQEELGGNTQEEEIDEMLVKAKDKKWDEKTKSISKKNCLRCGA
jgi:ATP-dependent Lon protease